MADSNIVTLQRPADEPLTEATEAAVAQLEATAATMRQAVSDRAEPVAEPAAAEEASQPEIDLAVLELKSEQEISHPGQGAPDTPATETVDLEPVKRALLELKAAPALDVAPPEPEVEAPAFLSVAEALPPAVETPMPVAEAPAIPLAPIPLPPVDHAPAAVPRPRAKQLPAEPALDVAPARIGVLLVNLGTPDGADPKSVRRYLKQFLSDPRVIENNSLLWRMVLNEIILPLRPRFKARAYKKIWNEELNESPLKTITRGQAEKLAATLGGVGEGIVVDWAMRYGHPSIPERLEMMEARGCERILLMPLYPQYSAATTATACDVAFRTLMKMRRQPSIRVVPPYYADQVYIEALASSINTQLKAVDFTPDVILASYHGLPQAYVDRGDPYEAHCIETTRLLRERLGLDESKLMMSYQSRFGRAKWLTPATDKTVKKLAKAGAKSLAVVMPGFAADCIETLEEIAIENAHIFRRAGGQNFVAIPCLNDSEPGMTVLWQVALRELKGWV